MQRRGIARGAAAASLAALLSAGPAAAHVTVQPAASRPADLQRYTVIVPNEEATATTAVALRVPQGVDFLLVEPRADWRAQVVRRGDRIAEVRWSGGRIEPDQYAELHFIARNPVEQGEVTWPAVQTYAGGDVIRWIGDRNSDQPAPRVRVAESATPVDVVSTHGQDVAANGSAQQPPATPGAARGDGGDGLALGLSIGALVIALSAMALTVLRGRRRRATPSGQAW